MRLRRLWLQQGRRRRLLDEVGQPISMAVLRTLYAIDSLRLEKISVGDVASELEVDASTASRLVETAVANGYALRNPSPDDRRKSVLNLTETGRAIVNDARGAREFLLSEVTSDWTQDEVTSFTVLLDRLHRDFEKIDKSVETSQAS